MISEWIGRNAAARGGAPYLEDAAETGTLTYAGLAHTAWAWARSPDRAGIPPGARVAVRWPEPLGYAAALAGLLAAGRVAVPLDPAAETARVLAVAGPRAAVGAAARTASRPGSPCFFPRTSRRHRT